MPNKSGIQFNWTSSQHYMFPTSVWYQMQHKLKEHFSPQHSWNLWKNRPFPDGQQTSEISILAFHLTAMKQFMNGQSSGLQQDQEERLLRGRALPLQLINVYTVAEHWLNLQADLSYLDLFRAAHKCPVWSRVYLEVNLSTLSPSRNFMALQWILPQFSGCPRGPSSSWMYCSHRSSGKWKQRLKLKLGGAQGCSK